MYDKGWMMMRKMIFFVVLSAGVVVVFGKANA
jgi:hypothetical protein